MLIFTKRILCCLSLVMLAGAAHAVESIAYRLPEGKEMHFDDARRAEQHLEAVRKLGCEARLDSHAGHTDVLYRSTRWQSMEVATDNLAHQWENWLKKAGFETIHGHAANHGTGHSHAGHNHGPGEAEEVSYQLREWKTIHVEDERRLPELVALMKGLGCEVRLEQHGGHGDLRVRCATWKHAEFESHRAAVSWERWLSENGFVTRHEH